jgi:hypothetical protein
MSGMAAHGHLAADGRRGRLSGWAVGNDTPAAVDAGGPGRASSGAMSDGDHPGDHPGDALPGENDPELAAAGAAFRAELRTEAAEWEQLAATQWLRRRSLADAARELLARGDRVAVYVGGRAVQGEVCHVGDDLACVTLDGARTVDVRLDGPAVWQVVQRVRAGGRSVAGGARRFAARLAEHEATGARVCVVTADGGEVSGAIVAVAVDHVVVDAPHGSRWLVPLAAVAAVWPTG